MSSVHGDDFTTSGPKSSLDRFVGELREKHELKAASRLRPGKHDDKEGRMAEQDRPLDSRRPGV